MADFRLALLGSCAAVIVAQTPADAQDLRMIDVPAGPARAAIAELARQTDLEIMAPQGDLAGARTNAVRGRMAPRDALQKLIAGTALQINSTGGRIITLRRVGDPQPTGVQKISAVVQDAVRTPAASAQPAAAAEVAVEEVVVTGSRIARRDLSSPTPIVTTTEEKLQQQGISNVESALNVMPQFVAAGDATATGRGAAGQRATLNLRGLGANRNLILLDGRRLPFSTATGVTDINIIPSALLQGVETITGGASAVYGSDAMSGVVNFLTRRSFEGLQIDSQYGNTFKTDRQTRDLTLTGGGEFAQGRGRAVLSVGYSDRERLRGTERSNVAQGTLSGFVGAGTYIPTVNNLPSQAVLNQIFTGYDGATTTVPRSGGTANLAFNNDGTLYLLNSTRNYKPIAGQNYVVFNGQVRQAVAPTIDVTSAQERQWMFGKFAYDLKEGLEAYAQVLAIRTETDQDDGHSLTQYGTLNTIPVTNPFIPADLRRVLASRTNPNAAFEWNARYVGVPHKGFNDRQSVSQIIVGLKGDLPVKDWTFDAYFSSDNTDSVQTVRNAVVKEAVQRLYNAADGGRSLCSGGFNPFGDANARSLSIECINYITATLKHTQSITQDIAEASIQGSLFALPAGDLRFSLVADHRTQEYAYNPDSRIRDLGAIEALSAQAATAGTLKVDEISGELLVPVLRDAPFVKALNIGLAYRYSDYNYAGGNSTYKIDGDWTVIPGLLIRGGYARAVRAPNMAESFFDRQSSPAPIGSPPTGGEPCDSRSLARTQGGAQLRTLCIATGVPASVIDNLVVPTTSAGNSITSGNPNLDPEKADTYTAGVVLRPQFGPDILQRMSFSADFYDIKISKVIGTIGAPAVLNACYNQDGSNPTYSPTNVYCTLLHRDQNGILFMVDTPYLNLGGLRVQGIDFTADLRQPIGPGTLTVGTNIGRKLKDQTKDFAASPWVELVGTGTRYKWQTVTNLGYEWGPAQAGLRFRYTSAQKDPTIVTRPASPAPGVKPFYAVDLNGAYKLSENIQLRGGVTNLWQPKAPLPNQIVAQTSGQYDNVGRQFYLAIRARF